MMISKIEASHTRFCFYYVVTQQTVTKDIDKG